MVHKYKVFPAGKVGQRKFKKQYIEQTRSGASQSESEIPKPTQPADVGAKAAHVKFLNTHGNDAHSHMTRKGGRKTRIDPLSLKIITDNLLRNLESKAASNLNGESSSDESDSDSSEIDSTKTSSA